MLAAACLACAVDDDVAGQDVANKLRVEPHEKLFEAGLAMMRRGEYKSAVTQFTRATAAAPGGLSARKGGQYAIYLAEALQAAGKKKEAVGLLKRCETHPDPDVRKIADNVLYVMQAPELVLNADNFVSIGPLEEVSAAWRVVEAPLWGLEAPVASQPRGSPYCDPDPHRLGLLPPPPNCHLFASLPSLPHAYAYA